MNATLWQFLVLADQTPFRSLGNQFRGRRARLETDDLITGALVVLIAVMVVYGLSWLLARQERQRSFNSPQALFKELCRAHQLDRPSQKLLARLAHWQRMAQPARLFLEPERFEPANLGPELLSQAEQFRALRERLFALPETAAAAALPPVAPSEKTEPSSFVRLS